MKILIEVPDDYTPKDGDAFDAIRDALEHCEIPSTLEVLKEKYYELNGIIKFQRSEQDNGGDCVCCEGAHVFSRYIEFEEQPTRHYQGLSIKNIDDWFSEMLSDDDGFENADIEINVKIKRNGGYYGRRKR